MLDKIQTKIKQVLVDMQIDVTDLEVNVEKTKKINLGDFSTNVALLLATRLKRNPLEIAEEIKSHLDDGFFAGIEVVRPGFINFKMANAAYDQFASSVDADYPYFAKTNERYNLEFVSANPTGLLHIGHARNAVIGDVIGKLLEKTGNKVATEYYVNDAGSQMDKLGSSVFVRYQQKHQIPGFALPEDSYHGDEIYEVADAITAEYGDKFTAYTIDENFQITDPTIRAFFHDKPGKIFLERIKKDLKSLGVVISDYYSEADIRRNDWIKVVLDLLQPYTFEQDGALWLRTTLGGDDKDRVLIKTDGSYTYFLPDIAYHYLKMTRNADQNKVPTKLIDLWGADHYGYFKRMDFALSCLGFPNKLSVVFIQMVRLLKDGQEFKMSKRTGNALTLNDLVETIGKDASRWFLMSNSPDKHLDIDIDLALSKGNDNPMYYVQYALVRAKTVCKKAQEFTTKDAVFLVEEAAERELLNQLMLFKDTIWSAAKTREPNKIINYLTTLAKLFHHYYEVVKIIDQENPAKTASHLKTLKLTIQIIENAFKLIGISPLEKM